MHSANGVFSNKITSKYYIVVTKIRVKFMSLRHLVTVIPKCTLQMEFSMQ